MSIVEEAFNLETGGCIITPGIPVERKNLKIKVGEPIELRRPDGTVLRTRIDRLPNPATPPIPIALSPEFRKTDVPAGTELWIEMEGRDEWPIGSPGTDPLGQPRVPHH